MLIISSIQCLHNMSIHVIRILETVSNVSKQTLMSEIGLKAVLTGKIMFHQCYVSAITKNPCITNSAPIRSGAGEIIGVVGVDLKLNM